MIRLTSDTSPASSQANAASQKVFLNNDFELTSNSAEGDPSRMKRFGFISAKPSEFLIVYRNGRLRTSITGQGGRCFKWPSDTVAIIPTTLKEVVFQANQITIDNVDVRLRGMVLYRISDPLRIYPLVNFSYRQKAEAKLARMIADMCRSTAKWLVANMGVEECVRRRKEEIAQSLKAEVASVVSSEGPEGWGVEIVTIDIQDIYIQDDELFASMQEKFKAERSQEAQLARLRSRQEVEKQEIFANLQLEKDRHDLEIRKAQLEAERVLARIDLQGRTNADRHQEQLKSAQLKATREKAQIELDRQRDEEKFKLERFREMSRLEIARATEEEEAKIQSFRIEEHERAQLFQVEQEQTRLEISAKAERERAEIQAESSQILNEEKSRSLREHLEAEGTATPASLQRMFIEKALPSVATAVAQSMSNLRFNVFQAGSDDGSANPLSFAFAQIMDLLHERLENVGLPLPEAGNPQPSANPRQTGESPQSAGRGRRARQPRTTNLRGAP